MSFHAPNKFRCRAGEFATTDADGNNGMFLVPSPINRWLRIICSDGAGWRHVSVSLPNSVPVWYEMCLVKDLFWDEWDAVMQIHPPKTDYVNYHKFCLHIWQPIDVAIPLPPSILVGPKAEFTTLDDARQRWASRPTVDQVVQDAIKLIEGKP